MATSSPKDNEIKNSASFDDMEEDLNSFIDQVMDDDDDAMDDIDEEPPAPLELADNEELDSFFDEGVEEVKQAARVSTDEDKIRQQQNEEEALLEKADQLTSDLDESKNSNVNGKAIKNKTSGGIDCAGKAAGSAMDSQSHATASNSSEQKDIESGTYTNKVIQPDASGASSIAGYVSSAADAVVDRSDQVAERIADGVEAAINSLSAWWQGGSSSS